MAFLLFHYYAYGLRIQAISSKKLGEASEGHLQNQHLYNDKELIEEADLGWYDYGFRNYDPQIGRFLQQDPLSDYYEALTPYHYAGGDPIASVDEEGLSIMNTVSTVTSVVEPIKEVVGDLAMVTVTAKVIKHKSTFLSVTGGLFKGLAKSLIGTVKAVGDMVMHPIRTAEGVVHAIANPIETAKAIGQVAKQTYLAYKNGNAEKRAEIIGEGIGELGQLFFGGAAVKAGAKMVKAARAAKAAEVAKVVKAEGGAAKAAAAAAAKKETGNFPLRRVGDLLESVDDVMVNPNLLKGKSPLQVEGIIGRAQNWRIETLGKGSKKGQGWVLREYTPRGNPTGRQIRWHPGGGHHGTESYWRVIGQDGDLGGIIR